MLKNVYVRLYFNNIMHVMTTFVINDFELNLQNSLFIIQQLKNTSSIDTWSKNYGPINIFFCIGPSVETSG